MTVIVDTHTHIYPRIYLDALGRRTDNPRVSEREGDSGLFRIFPGDQGRPITQDYWSIDRKLEFMDEHGIDYSVVSLGNPWLDPFEPAESLELASHLNEELATYSRRTAGRIVGMGCIPNASIDEVVGTLRDIAVREGLFGVAMGTRISGLAFDSPELDAVWAELERLALPVLVHPHYGVGLDEMHGYGHALQLALSFPYETTLALTRLVMSGVLTRFPDLRIIGSHGGGTLPYLAGRVDGCWRPDEVAQARHDVEPSKDFAKLWLDSLVYTPSALTAALDLVGPEKLMFGTDHPFAIANPQKNLEAIHRAARSSAVSEAVMGSNAIGLFGLKVAEAERVR
ncbi:amidohydrolase family protein [Rathayibacter soli]|uniref:amidohydrolase family protein n=1 Tax=Rathayibacter soli TaxID=3144168 RepID=UPI0027E5848E|nr:amidohydrolase family protein [Glaciibacter superstes]